MDILYGLIEAGATHPEYLVASGLMFVAGVGVALYARRVIKQEIKRQAELGSRKNIEDRLN